MSNSPTTDSVREIDIKDSLELAEQKSHSKLVNRNQKLKDLQP